MLLYWYSSAFFIISGFEISDVLGISDKDYSITFGLYFSVEWLEPRLNLSMELWGEENVVSEQDLVPGELLTFNEFSFQSFSLSPMKSPHTNLHI